MAFTECNYLSWKKLLISGHTKRLKLDEEKDLNRDNQLSCKNRFLKSRARENYVEQSDVKQDKMIKIPIMFLFVPRFIFFTSQSWSSLSL